MIRVRLHLAINEGAGGEAWLFFDTPWPSSIAPYPQLGDTVSHLPGISRELQVSGRDVSFGNLGPFVTITVYTEGIYAGATLARSIEELQEHGWALDD